MHRQNTKIQEIIKTDLIKYVIDYKDSTVHDKIYEKLDIGDGEKYCVYENPNALSLAYGVDKKLNDFS